MKTIIENKIYASIISICEGLEGEKIVNGHHLAQKLSIPISIGLLPSQQRKIYDALNNTPQRTKDIAKVCGLPSKDVSAQLHQIHEKTLLVSYILKGRYKLWLKKYENISV